MKVLVVDGLETLREHLLLSKNVRVKFVTCGRKNCRCRLGQRHGPYYYIRKKEGHRYRDIYVKKTKNPPHFKYEEVGSSVLLEIGSLEKIPEFLRDHPIFIVKKKVN